MSGLRTPQSGPAPTPNPKADAKAAKAYPPKSRYRRGWTVRVGGATVALVFGAAALSSCGGDDTTATDTSAPTVTATATVTAEPPAEPDQTDGDTKAPKPKKSQVGGGGGSGAGDTFTMPDERGKSLQAAQDDLQAVSGNPLFFSDSEDATGDGRGQWVDSGWKVCTQNRPPGSKVSVDDMDIMFGVVRDSEQCP